MPEIRVNSHLEKEECAAIAKLAVVSACLTPDHHSKAAYVGRVQQTETVTIIMDDGTSFETEVSFTVSWESISKILALIQKRAQI